jgi:hypothetical protein
MNYKMVKSGTRMLTGRENADVTIGWKLQAATGIVVSERKRENWRDVDESEIQPDNHWNQANDEGNTRNITKKKRKRKGWWLASQ